MRNVSKPYIVGLTGGIGAGKSTVSRLFSELGITVIDADHVARQVVEPDTFAYAAILSHYGSAILDKAGYLDRRRLRTIIFASNDEKFWLENLLHPLIRHRMQQEASRATSPYVIFSIPLLLESAPNPLIKRILVVDVPVTAQLERTMQRDQLSKAEVSAIIEQQISREQRLKWADDIIDNTVDQASLLAQVKQLHEKYLRLADPNPSAIPAG